MTMLKNILTGVTLSCCASTMHAAPLHDLTYDLFDAGSSFGGPRGIWFNSFRFATDFGTFEVSGTSATLSGQASNAALGGGFTFSVEMTHLCQSTVSDAGGSNVSVNNLSCGLSQNQPTGLVTGAQADGQTWDFWNWDDAYSLEGFGNLDGLVLDIMQAPVDSSKPFRVGWGADWDNPPPNLGGSGWFKVVDWECDINKLCANTQFTPPPGTGDFNFSMRASGDGGQIPIPATMTLLGIGLAGLGWSRRKTK